MERRLLLVFALTFLVIILFQPLLKKYLPQAPTSSTATQTPAQSPSQSPTSTDSHVPIPAGGATKQAASETETVVENDLYRVVFTNRGAQVKSWIIKK
jgi:YidC/Oxa1 family membrane protein insertase